MSGNLQQARDAAISAARDVPTLVAGLKAIDPALAQQITGKSLLLSKSPWGTLAVGVVSWAVSHYGLGWDQATCEVVAGAGVLVGAFIMRYVTGAPITTIMPTSSKGTDQ